MTKEQGRRISAFIVFSFQGNRTKRRISAFIAMEKTSSSPLPFALYLLPLDFLPKTFPDFVYPGEAHYGHQFIGN
jgi:hypothetical protein